MCFWVTCSEGYVFPFFLSYVGKSIRRYGDVAIFWIDRNVDVRICIWNESVYDCMW